MSSDHIHVVFMCMLCVSVYVYIYAYKLNNKDHRKMQTPPKLILMVNRLKFELEVSVGTIGA